MKVIIFATTLAFLSNPILANPADCSSALKRLITSEKKARVTESRMLSEIWTRAHQVTSSIHEGRIVLYRMVAKGNIQKGFVEYASRKIPQIVKDNPEIKITENTSILFFTSTGERNGLLRRMARSSLNDLFSDFTGVHPVEITSSSIEGTKTTTSLYIVVSDTFKDYREGVKATARTLDDIEDIIATNLEDIYNQLFSDDILKLSSSSQSLQKAMKTIGTPPGNKGIDLSESTERFLQSYRLAIRKWLKARNVTDLLYIGNSFWDEIPTPSSQEIELYKKAYQIQDETEFTSQYTQRALALRESLHTMLHKGQSRESNPSQVYGTEYNPEREVSYQAVVDSPLFERRHLDNGRIFESAQETHGTDFFSDGARAISIEDLNPNDLP